MGECSACCVGAASEGTFATRRDGGTSPRRLQWGIGSPTASQRGKRIERWGAFIVDKTFARSGSQRVRTDCYGRKCFCKYSAGIGGSRSPFRCIAGHREVNRGCEVSDAKQHVYICVN